MPRTLLLGAILSAFMTTVSASNTLAVASNIAHQNEIEAVNSVIEDFSSSIFNKDKKRFSQLFYAKDIPWLGIFSPSSIQFIQKINIDC